MHPFHSLFTEEPETEYVPDIFGRVGQAGSKDRSQKTGIRNQKPSSFLF